jgi:hypothetical protein
MAFNISKSNSAGEFVAAGIGGGIGGLGFLTGLGLPIGRHDDDGDGSFVINSSSSNR